MVRAAIDGLTHLVTVEQIARERGLEVSQIGYKSRAKSKTEAHDHRKAAVVGASPDAVEVA
jgi:small subunit ribosomal protein S5